MALSNMYYILEVSCRWLLALVFLYAGLPKLLDIPSFAATVGAYGLVPRPWLIPVAGSIAALEVLAATGLLLRKNWALLIMTALMAVFVTVLSYGIWLGLDIDCGCFAEGDPESEAFSGLRSALLRDLLLLLPLVYLVIRSGLVKTLAKGRTQ